MKTYRVSILREEIFEIKAKSKHEAELRVMEGLSADEMGTADIKVELMEE